LALNDPSLDSLVTAYCQEFNIVGRTASFLVLENDADYKRFNLEEERGKTLLDVGEFLDDAWSKVGRAVRPREAVLTMLNKIETRVPLPQGSSGRNLVDKMTDKDCELFAPPIDGALV